MSRNRSWICLRPASRAVSTELHLHGLKSRDTRAVMSSREKDPIKVYDARWEVHEFDDAAVTRLFESTLAYGRMLGVDTVTLSRDARLGAPHVMELGVAAAMRMGFRVFVRPEQISTPQGYFTALYVSQQHPKTMG